MTLSTPWRSVLHPQNQGFRDRRGAPSPARELSLPGHNRIRIHLGPFSRKNVCLIAAKVPVQPTCHHQKLTDETHVSNPSSSLHPEVTIDARADNSDDHDRCITLSNTPSAAEALQETGATRLRGLRPADPLTKPRRTNTRKPLPYILRVFRHSYASGTCSTGEISHKALNSSFAVVPSKFIPFVRRISPMPYQTG